jgi:hypothetical protein
MADGAGSKGFIGALSAGPLGTIARLLWFVILCLILFILGVVKGTFPIAICNHDFFVWIEWVTF